MTYKNGCNEDNKYVYYFKKKFLAFVLNFIDFGKLIKYILKCYVKQFF